ncbi:hypothetical protein SETIT_4G149200v2 [Setaria italica]|nr:hypothetical protein SETIT_4G149200v2 [Setaria italica]
MAKQVLSERTGMFPKYLTHGNLVRLLGTGLVLANGDGWKRHRKVLQPAFNMDKLNHGGDSRGVEIELSSQFVEVAANIISHTAFGTSYKEGKQVFLALKDLQLIAFSTLLSVQIPGLRYVPTANNRRTWKLDKKVRSLLMPIIRNRVASKDTVGFGEDLLGLMLEACAPESWTNECKTFFLAGQETTSQLLTWIMFLLSTHPGWQEKLREEVLRECGRDQPPIHQMLTKLKLVNMFLLETLRLYSPVPLIRRRTTTQVVLGNITVPEDTILTIPIAMMHRDKEVRGEHAGKFNPLRFQGRASASNLEPAQIVSALVGARPPSQTTMCCRATLATRLHRYFCAGGWLCYLLEICIFPLYILFP